jgi:hypothetical protein
MLPLSMCKHRTVPARARILMFITAHANNDRRRWTLSLGTIAAGTEVDRRQVEREIVALERGGQTAKLRCGCPRFRSSGG